MYLLNSSSTFCVPNEANVNMDMIVDNYCHVDSIDSAETEYSINTKLSTTAYVHGKTIEWDFAVYKTSLKIKKIF